MSDTGIAFVGEGGSALIASRDVPLYYFGEMRAHPIRLCENRPEDNRRPVYSWVMNNCWETNFKLDPVPALPNTATRCGCPPKPTRAAPWPS